MDRRSFIRVIGGASVFAATSGLAGCAELPDPTVAWVSPGSSERDVRRYALAHAILAPNPHNRQPWIARLEGERDLSLFIDRSRLLPATDPFNRQIVIGCGCFLELLSLAAGAKGFTTLVQPFPDGEIADRLDDRPFARVRFEPGGKVDPLFTQIVRRRSNKDPFEKDRVIPEADLQALEAAVAMPGLRAGSVGAGEALAGLKSLTAAAYLREVETPAALQESIDLMRIGAREVSQYRDGIDLTGAPIEVMKATGLLTRQSLAKPGTMAYDQALGLYAPLAATASGYVWIVSQGNDRVIQIASGRAYARMNLTATGSDIAMHPMSQGLQEYPEMAALKARVDSTVGLAAGERLQMLLRVGYGKAPPPSPRRGLAALLSRQQV
ncbi:MAG: hypothetical protein QE280_08845 [Caulobacter sp.]|nr:hypothetical protein [Caulobacter sp.]